MGHKPGRPKSAGKASIPGAFSAFFVSPENHQQAGILDAVGSILRLPVRAAKRSAFAVAIGLVVAVMAFSSCALQMFGGLRAGQNESSESSPYETSERIHVAVLQIRSAKAKGTLPCRLQSVVHAADIHHSIRSALAESRGRIPFVACWSASIRC
jgi:hypothetical protein